MLTDVQTPFLGTPLAPLSEDMEAAGRGAVPGFGHAEEDAAGLHRRMHGCIAGVWEHVTEGCRFLWVAERSGVWRTA